jgi:hypothetical protein
LKALEKHCIEAGAMLDKNGEASKKLVSAHLLLWICRRFSTGAAISHARLTFGWRLLPASFLQTEKRLQEDSFEAGQDGRFAR